jgi:O-antigen ligase
VSPLVAAAVLAVAATAFAGHHLLGTALALGALAAVALAAWDVETALGILLVFLPLRTLAASIVPLPLRFVADTVVIVLLARLVLLHPDELWPVDRIEAAFLAFGVVGVVLTLRAHAPLAGAVLELRDLLLFPVLYAVVRRLHRLGDGPGPDWWERFVPVGLAAIALVGVQGLLADLVVGHPFLVPHALAVAEAHPGPANRGRPYGWLDNPNVFGQLGLFALVLTYYHFRAQAFRPLLPFILLAALFAAMVAFSFSRSAYIALVVGAVLLTLWATSRREKAALLACAVAILLIVLSTPTGRARTLGAVGHVAPTAAYRSGATRAPATRPGHGPATSRRPGASYVARSLRAGRLRTLVEAARLVRRYPLGTGLGTFGSAGSKVFGTPLDRFGLTRSFFADDNYAVILVETGLPGFVLFLGIGVALLLTVRRLRVAPFDRALLTVLFVSVAILGFTGNTWEQLNLTLYPWLALGVLHRPEGMEPELLPRPSPPADPVA